MGNSILREKRAVRDFLKRKRKMLESLSAGEKRSMDGLLTGGQNSVSAVCPGNSQIDAGGFDEQQSSPWSFKNVGRK